MGDWCRTSKLPSGSYPGWIMHQCGHPSWDIPVFLGRTGTLTGIIVGSEEARFDTTKWTAWEEEGEYSPPFSPNSVAIMMESLFYPPKPVALESTLSTDHAPH